MSGINFSALQTEAPKEFRGQIIVPGGVTTTVTAPADPAAQSLVTGWSLNAVGAGAAATNQDDSTLLYTGWRLRCAPAAQNNSRLSGAVTNATSAPIGPLLAVAKGRGKLVLEALVDIRRAIVGAADAFHCHVGLASNYPSAGGFIGVYTSDVVAPNWHFGFLSGAAAYNFPFPVPQRSQSLGINAIANPLLIRLEVEQREFRIHIDGSLVFTLRQPVLTANEWAVLAGAAGPIPRAPQFVAAKAAGDDTVDLWVIGSVRHGLEP